jgi:hypothetical protein
VLSRTNSIQTYVFIAITLGALGLQAVPLNQIYATLGGGSAAAAAAAGNAAAAAAAAAGAGASAHYLACQCV